MKREMLMAVRVGMAHKHTQVSCILIKEPLWKKSGSEKTKKTKTCFRVVHSICQTGRVQNKQKEMRVSDQSNTVLKLLEKSHYDFQLNCLFPHQALSEFYQALNKTILGAPCLPPPVQSYPGGPIRRWNLPLEELAQWQGAPGLHLLQTFLLYFIKPVSVSLEGTYYCTWAPDLLLHPLFKEYY